MRAFLLAAGRGERLRPLTDRVPKCLLPVGGRPLLAHWLDLLARHGVGRVLVNTHHLAREVERFAAGYHGPVALHLAYEPVLLGSAGTVRARRAFVAAEPCFLVAYADTLTDADLGGLIAFHRARGAVLTIGLFRVPDPERAGVAEVDGEGWVLSFVEKPARPRSNLASAGIYVAGLQLLARLPARTPLDFGYDVLPMLVGRGLYGLELVGSCVRDIGTPESYAAARADWQGRAALARDTGLGEAGAAARVEGGGGRW